MVDADRNALAREARARRLAKIQAEIDAGCYESAEKLERAVEQMIRRERPVSHLLESAEGDEASQAKR
jgi:hypothetical protein